MLWTAVPLAPIDEHVDLCPREDDVRPSASTRVPYEQVDPEPEVGVEQQRT